jgi:hypothetical protein
MLLVRTTSGYISGHFPNCFIKSLLAPEFFIFLGLISCFVGLGGFIPSGYERASVGVRFRSRTFFSSWFTFLLLSIATCTLSGIFIKSLGNSSDSLSDGLDDGYLVVLGANS